MRIIINEDFEGNVYYMDGTCKPAVMVFELL